MGIKSLKLYILWSYQCNRIILYLYLLSLKGLISRVCYGVSFFVSKLRRLTEAIFWSYDFFSRNYKIDVFVLIFTSNSQIIAKQISKFHADLPYASELFRGQWWANFLSLIDLTIFFHYFWLNSIFGSHDEEQCAISS